MYMQQVTEHDTNKHLRHAITEKYDKDWYFRVNDDNSMTDTYISSITYTEMDQLNTYNPIVMTMKDNR